MEWYGMAACLANMLYTRPAGRANQEYVGIDLQRLQMTASDPHLPRSEQLHLFPGCFGKCIMSDSIMSATCSAGIFSVK